ncbi:MAG: phosphoglucosamine mutase, partial [Candidatus Bathyarchaeia archaeon]
MSERTLFGTNGIRGVVNNEMTPELAVKVGCAIGTYFDRARILLGYDVRTSSTFISAAVASGLISTGCIVYDVGLAPTPAIQFAVKNMNMDGAVIITASHNPPEYNGIKVVGKDGVEVTREEEMKIERFFFEDSFHRSSWKELGTLQPLQGILEPYMEAVKSHVDVSSICKKHFKVVVDPANSVGALVTPRLLRDLGCEVFTLNGNLDGHFPGRLPEPRR